MSVKSWMEEFYPIFAGDLARRDGVTDIELVKHSMQKWNGAMPENLKKHKVKKDYPTGRAIEDIDGGYFIFGGASCALCEKHVRGSSCGECPLFRHLGFDCDGTIIEDEIVGDIYYQATVGNNPQLMIGHLEDTLKMLEGEQGEGY